MSTQREASRERIAQVHPADRFAAMFGEQVKPAPDHGEQVKPAPDFGEPPSPSSNPFHPPHEND